MSAESNAICSEGLRFSGLRVLTFSRVSLSGLRTRWILNLWSLCKERKFCLGDSHMCSSLRVRASGNSLDR